MGCGGSTAAPPPGQPDTTNAAYALKGDDGHSSNMKQMAMERDMENHAKAEEDAEFEERNEGGSWDSGKGGKRRGTDTGGAKARRTSDEESRHKAALAIQGAQRQRDARHKVNGKRNEKEKKKKAQEAEQQARMRMNVEAYDAEHERAATTIQCAQRTKAANQKVKKKKKEKTDIGGIGGLM